MRSVFLRISNLRFAVFNRCCSRQNITQIGNVRRHFEKYKLFSVLAFIWPLKKMEVTPAVEPEPIVEPTLLENADTLFENGSYQQCYDVLTAATDDEDVEVKWRICRALYNISQSKNISEEEKKETIYKAYDLINDTLNKNADHYAVHKWYALLLDAKSAYEGIKTRITQLENVKKHMNLAVTLNPKDATTLYMLGEWCYQVTDMPWHQRKIAETLFASPPRSTYEEALEYFSKAEAVSPRFYSLNLLMLGKTYLRLKKNDPAKYYLHLAASYPAKSNDDHRANKEAAELLKKFK